MRGLAWSTVSELEPKMQRLEQQIEQILPSKLSKIEACLGPAQQKVEEMQKLQEGQVCKSICSICSASSVCLLLTLFGA